MPREQVSGESIRDSVKHVGENEHRLWREVFSQHWSLDLLERVFHKLVNGPFFFFFKSYLNKLPRNTEVRIFLKTSGKQQHFFLQKNLQSPCDYQHRVTGKARAVRVLKLMQLGETL